MKKKNSVWRKMLKSWQLYVLILPTVIYLLIFAYAPMVGIQISFRDYTFAGGMFGSKWVGLKHFETFIKSIQFEKLVTNTVKLSAYSLFFGFPLPIILALLLNECKSLRLKKVVQTLTYAPHFISTVVLVSMVTLFTSEKGIINVLVELLGGTGMNYMGKAEWFRPIYIISGMWQGTGWGSIIYMAALSSIDPQLYEAAEIDGANRLQKIWHISIPGILGTVVILLILNFGSIMSVGHEKAYLMQNGMNLATSEIISTYVYKIGLLKAQYSYTAAIGLFNSVINIILLLIVNKISKKVADISMF